MQPHPQDTWQHLLQHLSPVVVDFFLHLVIPTTQKVSRQSSHTVLQVTQLSTDTGAALELLTNYLHLRSHSLAIPVSLLASFMMAFTLLGTKPTKHTTQHPDSGKSPGNTESQNQQRGTEPLQTLGNSQSVWTSLSRFLHMLQSRCLYFKIRHYIKCSAKGFQKRIP